MPFNLDNKNNTDCADIPSSKHTATIFRLNYNHAGYSNEIAAKNPPTHLEFLA